MGEILTKKKIQRLKTELDGNVNKYVDIIFSILNFYKDIRIESIKELLTETDSNDMPMIDHDQAEILNMLNRCITSYEKKLQSHHRAKLKFGREFDENRKNTLDTITEELYRGKLVKNNMDNLHDDIMEGYFRRFMTVKNAVSSYVSSLSKSDLSDFLKCIDKQPHFGQNDFKDYSNMLNNTICETILRKDCSYTQMIARIAHGVGRFAKISSLIDVALKRNMPHKIYFEDENVFHDADRPNLHKTIVCGMTAYFTLEAMLVSKLIAEGNLTPFFDSMDSLEAYYPKKDLELENLESLLTPGYEYDSEYDQRYKVVKLKKGNKDERNKIKSKVMVHEDGRISLKYIAFGIYGKKIDVVLEYSGESLLKLLHLDYSEQKRLTRSNGKQFKTYGSLQKMMLGERIYDFSNPDEPKLLGNIEDNFNPMMITDDDGASRLNLAAIGGEALLETDRYIRTNYNKIIEAAKNSR